MFRKFVPASAQDSPVSINLGGGFTIRCSDLKDSFGVGGNLPSGIISSIPLSANQRELRSVHLRVPVPLR
jgi:hypothetical protein